MGTVVVCTITQPSAAALDTSANSKKTTDGYGDHITGCHSIMACRMRRKIDPPGL